MKNISFKHFKGPCLIDLFASVCNRLKKRKTALLYALTPVSRNESFEGVIATPPITVAQVHPILSGHFERYMRARRMLLRVTRIYLLEVWCRPDKNLNHALVFLNYYGGSIRSTGSGVTRSYQTVLSFSAINRRRLPSPATSSTCCPAQAFVPSPFGNFQVFTSSQRTTLFKMSNLCSPRTATNIVFFPTTPPA